MCVTSVPCLLLYRVYLSPKIPLSLSHCLLLPPVTILPTYVLSLLSHLCHWFIMHTTPPSSLSPSPLFSLSNTPHTTLPHTTLPSLSCTSPSPPPLLAQLPLSHIMSTFRVLRLLRFIPQVRRILWTVINSLEVCAVNLHV